MVLVTLPVKLETLETMLPAVLSIPPTMLAAKSLPGKVGSGLLREWETDTLVGVVPIARPPPVVTVEGR